MNTTDVDSVLTPHRLAALAARQDAYALLNNKHWRSSGWSNSSRPDSQIVGDRINSLFNGSSLFTMCPEIVGTPMGFRIMVSEIQRSARNGEANRFGYIIDVETEDLGVIYHKTYGFGAALRMSTGWIVEPSQKHVLSNERFK